MEKVGASRSGLKVIRSLRLVHKVYGSDAGAMPIGFKKPKRHRGRSLSAPFSGRARKNVPGDGMQPFRF